MRWLKLILLLAMIVVVVLVAESVEVEAVEEAASLRGVGRFLAQRSSIKCNKYPKICRAKGSPGPDCCKKRCVNVAKDGANCGKCGRKCKFSEICCKGKCINPFTHKKHCGGCGNKCDKGSKCAYGLCSYSD